MTAARSFKGYVTKPQLRRKQRLHAQRAVGERAQAGDAASGPGEAREGWRRSQRTREEREGGMTQPADHEMNTWVSTWMGEQIVENQRLEKNSPNKHRRVT